MGPISVTGSTTLEIIGAVSMESLAAINGGATLTVNGRAIADASEVSACSNRGQQVNNKCVCWTATDTSATCAGGNSAASADAPKRPLGAKYNPFAIGVGVGMGALVIILLAGLFLYRRHAKRRQRDAESRHYTPTVVSSSSHAAANAKLLGALDPHGFGNVHYAIARGDLVSLNQLLSQPRSPDHIVPTSPGSLPLSPDSLPGVNAPRDHVYERIKGDDHPYALPGTHDSKRPRHQPPRQQAAPLPQLDPATLDFSLNFDDILRADLIGDSAATPGTHGVRPNAYSIGDTLAMDVLVPGRSPGLATVVEGEGNITNLRDGGGNTPVAWAVRLGNVQALKSLLEWGADVNITNNQSQSPLHVACVVRLDMTIVRTLLAAGANPNAPDAEGMTPFLYACSMGTLSLVEVLLECDIDVTAGDQRRMGPLHLSAARGHADVIRMLLQHPPMEAATNARDILGWTPLHWAASAGHGPSVRQLLQSGTIDPCLGNKKGEIPLHIAARDGNMEVIDVLLTQGRSTQRLLQLMAVTDDGFSARDFAVKNGQTPTIAM